MAAAMAKVLRGARSGSSSSRLPIPAVFRRMAQEGVAQGSSPAAPAAGMGRLMHTGAKLPFGRQALTQQQKVVRMGRFSSRRSYMGDDGPDHFPFSVFYMLCAMSLGIALPNGNILKRIKGE